MLKFLHLISAKKEKSHNCDHLMQHHVTDEMSEGARDKQPPK